MSEPTPKNKKVSRTESVPMGDVNVATTVVKANARLEMLRVMAWYRDFCRKSKADGDYDGDMAQHYSEWVPLFAGEPQNPREDVRLALKECVAIGHMETTNPKDRDDELMDRLQGPPVRITDAGYDWIRSHDLLGEDAQEARSAPPAGESVV